MGDTTEGSRVEDMVGITYQVRHKFIVLAFKKLNTFETMNVFMGVNQLQGKHKVLEPFVFVLSS
jgi:hypothetical protein